MRVHFAALLLHKNACENICDRSQIIHVVSQHLPGLLLLRSRKTAWNFYELFTLSAAIFARPFSRCSLLGFITMAFDFYVSISKRARASSLPINKSSPPGRLYSAFAEMFARIRFNISIAAVRTANFTDSGFVSLLKRVGSLGTGNRAAAIVGLLSSRKTQWNFSFDRRRGEELAISLSAFAKSARRANWAPR